MSAYCLLSFGFDFKKNSSTFWERCLGFFALLKRIRLEDQYHSYACALWSIELEPGDEFG